jgi:hypothetical protein
MPGIGKLDRSICSVEQNVAWYPVPIEEGADTTSRTARHHHGRGEPD